MFRTINIKTHTIILKATVGIAINLAVIHIKIFILHKIAIKAINTNIRKISQNTNSQNIRKEINIITNHNKGINSNNSNNSNQQDNSSSHQGSSKNNNNIIITDTILMNMRKRQLKKLTDKIVLKLNNTTLLNILSVVKDVGVSLILIVFKNMKPFVRKFSKRKERNLMLKIIELYLMIKKSS